jgi:isocitrate/isopropylmalate dehydrogenase
MKKVTLISGDGVGPELAQAARQCIDATGVRIEWDLCEAGLDVMDREGKPKAGGHAGEGGSHFGEAAIKCSFDHNSA